VKDFDFPALGGQLLRSFLRILDESSASRTVERQA